MKVYNVNDPGDQKIRYTKFPDSQPHINIDSPNEGEDVIVICSITSSDKLLWLLELTNAIDNANGNKYELRIPYLMGARFDRIMNEGDSFDLKIIANIINSLNYSKVALYDIHSDVASALINKAFNITNRSLVINRMAIKPDSVLICPDAGAVKKVEKYLNLNDNIVDVVYCNKLRDLSNGKITLKVLEPEKCKDRNCVIIDDICDGGGTFLAIADQIEPSDLRLIVTHGIFSNGFVKLSEKFDHIITSNSYRGLESYPEDVLDMITIVNLT
jgi:ribose-phosphate pyrophosphokinase